MGIIYWMSDVCSSDLLGEAAHAAVGGVEDRPVRGRGVGHHRCAGRVGVYLERREEFGGAAAPEEMREIEVDGLGAAADPAFEVGAIVAGKRRSHVRRGGRKIGRASCRERVCQYV